MALDVYLRFPDKSPRPTDPEIIELRSEIRRLSQSVDRLSSLIKVEAPHREHKEVRRNEKAEHEEDHEHDTTNRDSRKKKPRQR